MLYPLAVSNYIGYFLSKNSITIIFSITLVVSSSTSRDTEATPLVTTSLGLIRGYTTRFAHIYKGIPYARPPVGPLRWQPPQPPVPWNNNVKDAMESSPGCPQVGCDHTTPPIACPKMTSEDCLHLEIFTPLNATLLANLPVMIFIHGGNFFYMSGSSPLFSGEVFVQRGNVVLVNINYRLGALGFLVTGRKSGDATGNYGILDQRLAFQWVKKNIKGFGGDPEKITLFGQSAGSQSILHHMMSPKSSPYFRAAILESDPISLPYRNFDEAFVLGGLLAEKLNCPVEDMECMRSKSAQEIAEASYATRAMVSSAKLLELFEPYGPYVDGVEVKGQPIDVLKEGGIALNKPIMIGTLTEETVLYIYGAFNASVSLEEYIGLAAVFKPEHALQILQEYPPDVLAEDQREILVKMSTDYVFACPTRNVSRELVNKMKTNVWIYVWNHAMSFPGWGHVTFCEGRVCHGTELVFVFDTASSGNFTMTPEETKMSFDVIDYWTNFAWSGDPNKKGARPKTNGKDDALLLWPKYNLTTKWSYLEFATPARHIGQNYKAQQCDFWDSVGYS